MILNKNIILSFKLWLIFLNNEKRVKLFGQKIENVNFLITKSIINLIVVKYLDKK